MKLISQTLLIVGLASILSGHVLAASCASKAGSVAARNGGQVLSVSSFNQNGTAMCRITILVKSRNGGPARKKTVTVRK